MLRKDIEEKFPFISVVTYGQKEFVGIINNQDNFVTSMYVYTDLMDDADKTAFMELGEAWWWESNRMIPISIFMRKDMERFRHILTTMNSKDVKVTLDEKVYSIHRLFMFERIYNNQCFTCDGSRMQ